MATVNVVKGSADEAILRAQYGDSINYNYSDRNQFVGADRAATNKMYQDAIGSTGKNAGDLYKYNGVSISDGYDSSKPRQQAIQPPAYTPPPVQDNSALIKQMFDEQKAATVAQLKQAILTSQKQYQDTISSTPGTYDKLRNAVQSNYNNATGAYQSVIDKAPGQYQPLRDQASAAGYKNLSSLREMLANQGQQGGVNRTDETAVNTATGNQINALNLQQQNTMNDANSAINNLNKDKELKLADLATQQQQVIDQANRAIADLQASGNLQEAQMVAQNASDKIRALIDEGNRVQSTSYQYSQDAMANARADAGLTGYLNGTQTMAGRANDVNTALSQAQLREVTDPNSVTNQLARLNLNTAQLNYAALPDQLKAQAEKIAQDLQLGKINLQTAQTQLDYLPSQIQASLTKATSGSSAPSVTEQNYNDKQSAVQNTSQAMDYLNKWASGQALDNNGQNLGRATRDGILSWINQNSGELTRQGIDVNSLYKWADQTFQWNPS